MNLPEDVEFYMAGEAQPPGTGVWAYYVGIIHGLGDSHYHWFPDYYCWHLVAKGKARVETPDGVFEVGPGGMFTLWPYVEIDYRPVDDGWQVYFFKLLGDQAGALSEACGFRAAQPVIQPANPAMALENFAALVNAYRDGDWRVYLHQSYIYNIIAACRAEADAPPKRDRRAVLVEQAKLLAATHIGRHLNVDELAARLRVGRGTLFHAFREVLQTSPSAYLAELRLNYACELLRRRPPLALVAVAQMAGFSDLRYFHRCFQARFGVSPGEWRLAEAIAPASL